MTKKYYVGLVVGLVMFSSVGMTGRASASFTYEYSGPTFNTVYSGTDFTTSDFINITITSPYQLLSNTDYSNNPAVLLTMAVPGHLALTRANSSSYQLNIYSVNGDSAPTSWALTLQQSSGPWIQSLHDGGGSSLDFAYSDLVNGGGAMAGVASGTNTTIFSVVSTPAPVPIPGAAWLLGSGLVGLVGLRRKKKE